MAGVSGVNDAQVVELGSTTPAELILRDALGLSSGLGGKSDGPVVNPSGSPLCANR